MQRTVFSGMTKVGGDSRPWEGAWGAGDQRGCKPDHLQSVPRRAAERVTAPRAFSGPLRSPSLPKDTCVWQSLRLAGSLAEMNSHKTPAKFPS